MADAHRIGPGGILVDSFVREPDTLRGTRRFREALVDEPYRFWNQCGCGLQRRGDGRGMWCFQGFLDSNALQAILHLCLAFATITPGSSWARPAPAPWSKLRYERPFLTHDSSNAYMDGRRPS